MPILLVCGSLVPQCHNLDPEKYADTFTSYLHCNDKGDDPGISLKYNYDLSIVLPSHQDTYHYYRNISSWRC